MMKSCNLTLIIVMIRPESSSRIWGWDESTKLEVLGKDYGVKITYSRFKWSEEEECPFAC
jgi:hypothetical protein